jgi:hypothetical protein
MHSDSAKSRYTIYRYSEKHLALDCEDCGGKLFNIRPETSGQQILDVLNTHEKGVHNG